MDEPLEAEAVAEIEQTRNVMPATYANDHFKFDEAGQVTIIGPIESLKIMWFQGVWTNPMPEISIISTSRGDHPEVELGLMLVTKSKRDNTWSPVQSDWQQVRSDEPLVGVTVVHRRLDTGQLEIANNTVFGIVAVTRYQRPAADREKVRPWIAYAHRLVGRQGRTSYLFAADTNLFPADAKKGTTKDDRVEIEPELYVKEGGGRFLRLNAPDRETMHQTAMSRLAEWRDALGKSLQSQENAWSWTRDRHKSGTDFLKAACAAISRYEPGMSASRKSVYAFTFDPQNSQKLDLLHLNLILFSTRPNVQPSAPTKKLEVEKDQPWK